MNSKILSFIVVLCVVQTVVLAEIASKTIPVNINCGQSSSYKWINLVQSGSQQCSYTISSYHIYVCQLLVEFTTNLMIPQPSVPGAVPTCRADSRIKIGKFEICGANYNQHVYVPFDGSSLYNKYIINAAGAGGTYTIKVTQVVCPPSKAAKIEAKSEEPLQLPVPNINPLKIEQLITPRTYDTDIMAPVGCDQYFTQPQGFVESINWNNAQGKYPGYIQYNVCFKRQSSSTRIRLYATDFSLEANSNTIQYNEMCYDSGATPGYSSDYIYVPASKIVETGLVADYYCGDLWQGKTIESTIFGMYWFTFNAGSSTGITLAKRVFKFEYTIT